MIVLVLGTTFSSLAPTILLFTSKNLGTGSFFNGLNRGSDPPKPAYLIDLGLEFIRDIFLFFAYSMETFDMTELEPAV